MSNLTKTFHRRGVGSVEAVKGVSFSVPRGTVLGLLGPNGAGKSTTIKCILGLISPDAGDMQVYGYDVQRDPRSALKRMGAVLEGSRNVYWRLTPRENMNFFASIQGHDPRRDREYHDHLVERLDLTDRVDRPVLELSQGMKQKVAIACALVRRTPLLFLDEPTLGLDVQTSHEMRSLLRGLVEDEDRTVVVSSHDMKVVQEVCARVIIIKDGVVVADDLTRNLLALFRTRAYRIEMPTDLPAPVLGQLQARFARAGVNASPGHYELEVEVTEPADLYELMDVLRDAGVIVEGIYRDQPDLERAFLRIVDGGRESRGDVRA